MKFKIYFSLAILILSLIFQIFSLSIVWLFLPTLPDNEISSQEPQVQFPEPELVFADYFRIFGYLVLLLGVYLALKLQKMINSVNPDNQIKLKSAVNLLFLACLFALFIFFPLPVFNILTIIFIVGFLLETTGISLSSLGISDNTFLYFFSYGPPIIVYILIIACAFLFFKRKEMLKD